MAETSNHEWAASLKRIRSVFEEADVSELWVSRQEALQTLERVTARFEDDYEALSGDLGYIFSDDKDSAARTDKTIDLIRAWHKSRRGPSMAAIVAVTMEHFGFDREEEAELVDAVMAASVLGDISVDLPYHNNLHFHKVTLHAARLIAAHNSLFEGTGIAFDHRKSAALLICGAAHDLGHDGSGNIIDHKYHFARLEQRSFKMLQPFIARAGLDQSLLNDIKVMLITTDVSPFGDPISPARQLRAAYEYHFGTSDPDTLDLSEELAILEERADLTLMCMILHEADLMNSTGLSYDVTTFETALLSEEIGKKDALPEDLYLFLAKICDRGMLSDAWQQLALDNYKEIYDRALADVRAGNKPYPVSAQAPFLEG